MQISAAILSSVILLACSARPGAPTSAGGNRNSGPVAATKLDETLNIKLVREHLWMEQTYPYCRRRPVQGAAVSPRIEQTVILTAFQVGEVMGAGTDTAWYDLESAVPVVAKGELMLPAGGSPRFVRVSSVREATDQAKRYVVLDELGRVADANGAGWVYEIRFYNAGDEGDPDPDAYDYRGIWCVVQQQQGQGETYQQIYHLVLVDQVIVG